MLQPVGVSTCDLDSEGLKILSAWKDLDPLSILCSVLFFWPFHLSTILFTKKTKHLKMILFKFFQKQNPDQSLIRLVSCEVSSWWL